MVIIHILRSYHFARTILFIYNMRFNIDLIDLKRAFLIVSLALSHIEQGFEP